MSTLDAIGIWVLVGALGVFVVWVLTGEQRMRRADRADDERPIPYTLGSATEYRALAAAARARFEASPANQRTPAAWFIDPGVLAPRPLLPRVGDRRELWCEACGRRTTHYLPWDWNLARDGNPAPGFVCLPCEDEATP